MTCGFCKEKCQELKGVFRCTKCNKDYPKPETRGRKIKEKQ